MVVSNSAGTTVLSRLVLVVNRAWYPVHVTTVRRSICMVYQAVADVVATDTLQTHPFADWVCLVEPPTQHWISTPSIPIPVPDVTPLNPPLGLVPPIPLSIRPVEGTAKYSPVRAALIGLAKAARSSDAVRGSGSLNVVRYGRVLKARKLVGVRGAGPAFDGLHYVEGVTHNIKRGEYTQSFNLTRNGLLSTLPRVPA